MSREHKRDARRLADSLAREGFDVRINGSGHYEVRSGRELVTSFSYSPSCRRWEQNALRYLKRWKREHGIPSAPG